MDTNAAWEQLELKVEFLKDKNSYEHKPNFVKAIETHLS